MGLFDKLFGRRRSAPTAIPSPAPQPAPCPPAPADPAKDPNLIRVFDGYGRELFLPRETWRTQILPQNVREAWNEPDKLYGIIVMALNDGFRADVVSAAERLHHIDPDRARGTCAWGVVLMEEGRLDDAERVFDDHLKTRGVDGLVLVNLAKVYWRRGDAARAEETVWRALEHDPNVQDAVLWYEAMRREREGPDAGRDALRRIAALPGSWQAQLWLARAALASGHLDAALKLYDESLSRLPRPVPADVLQQMSGDLGTKGHLRQLIDLTEPLFVAETHGLAVGNNLIKAYVELHRFDEAQAVLDRLYAIKRLDWKESLGFWDNEIGKARVAGEPSADAGEMSITAVAIEGPVWLRPDSPAELLGAKPKDELLITFLGGSITRAEHPTEIQVQLSDNLGRMSRALPLYLAEQAHFRTRARVQTIQPWVNSPRGGAFAVFGKPWTAEGVIKFGGQSTALGDYVVVTHVDGATDPWTAKLRLLRASDGVCLASDDASFTVDHMEDALPGFATRATALIASHAPLGAAAAQPLYDVPAGPHFSSYLLRLEQLLAVRCASMEGANPLHGEREIIDGNVQLCVDCPRNVTTRLLLAQTLIAMKRIRPDIIPEFRDKVALLQHQYPLDEPTEQFAALLIEQAMLD